jgi:carbon monoxide dehydrogenase subunit G
MTRIESDTRIINKKQEQIFNFLSDFNNFETLMPDKVVDWKSDKESCSFTIQGLASLGMRIVEKEPYSYIKIIDEGKVPFKFEFYVNIKNISENKSEVMLIFDADLNMMLKMMAVKPLKNFLNMLLDELETQKLPI